MTACFDEPVIIDEGVDDKKKVDVVFVCLEFVFDGMLKLAVSLT
jgi:hypothetical protein